MAGTNGATASWRRAPTKQGTRELGIPPLVERTGIENGGNHVTLPGGPAEKRGNLYEKWWTLSELVRVLAGETESVRIEDPNVDKAEFVVTASGRRELHQVKRSHWRGKWTLSDLARDGLLRAMGEQLSGNDDWFVFASGSEARELADLCCRARAAESDREFDQRFLAADSQRQRFTRLLKCWGCDLPTARELLQRIYVRTIDERALRDSAKYAVAWLFRAERSAVVAELRGIAEDSVHCTLSREVLLEKLTQRGIPLREVGDSDDAVSTVRSARDITETFLNGARRKLIQHELVPQAAAATLLSRLEGSASDSVLTGKAGSGKTACTVQLADCLRERGIPTLAFRLDRYLGARTTTDLGRALGLKDSPIVALAAAAEANRLPGVLIVDQLDAVSTMSGRSSGAFDLVDQLLHEARGARRRAAVHTVVVCRAFDWVNDARLRNLLPPDLDSQVEVGEFSIEEVKSILLRAGFDPTLFRRGQLDLLLLPQNLALFLEADFDASATPVFDKAIVLFDRYWYAKRKSVEEQVRTSQDAWVKAISVLCDEMTTTQELSVPRESLDGFSPNLLERMSSEGVLTFDGRRYGFGHESFFDYCFARLFVSRTGSLVSFLTQSEQHLFRRAQVRQVLGYCRDTQRERYLRELSSLLSDEGIRAHVKELAFALLAEVADPTEREWEVWEPWTRPTLSALAEGTPNADRLSALAWRRLFASPSWFNFIEQRGLVESWLASDNDRLVELAVNYLRFHLLLSPDRVAALLEPYTDRGEPWSTRLRNFMQTARFDASRRIFDLFLRLIDNGALDEMNEPMAGQIPLWSMVHTRVRNHPEWMSEVLAHWIRRRLAALHAAGETPSRRDILGSDTSLTSMIAEAAEHVPSVYVEYVLPIVLDISDSTLIDDEPPRRDSVWMDLIKSQHPSGEDVCLHALAGALASLAREGAVDLTDVVTDLRRRETHVANHLLLAVYRGGAARNADEAASMFYDEPWRFRCGLSDNQHWCAMETIQAIVPQCATESRDRLESAILEYACPFERTTSGYKRRGRAQFSLLSVIPAELRSARANARFRELERKLKKPDGEPTGVRGGWIGSPIERHGTDRMTDEQWLSAIAKYRAEFPTYFTLGEFKGGATQLAQALATRASEEPERFARLSLRFPVDTHTAYLGHTLAALKDASVDSDLKLEVCRKAFSESREACGRAIADVLGKIEGPLPNDATEMLHWLMTEHSDPDTERWKQHDSRGEPDPNGITDAGLQSTRGGAAIAIRDVIRRKSGNIDRFGPTLDRMVRDRSASVLSWVAATLRAVALHDPSLAMRLFRDMDLSETWLLATRHVQNFIEERLADSFTELRPILDRMVGSSEPEIGRAGARLATLALLMDQDSADLVEDSFRGGPDHRLGVAEVASANIAVPECRRWATRSLTVLFNDDNVEVRAAAESCFRELRHEALDEYEELIEAFCDSPALQDGSRSLLHLLEESRGRLPGITCVVCEKLLAIWTKGNGDILTGHVDTLTLATLVFRTYQQHQSDEWGDRTLDLIDRMCLDGIGDAGRQLEQFER